MLDFSSWNETVPADLRLRMEMFSSYLVSSVDAEDGFTEAQYKILPNGDVVMNIAKVRR